MKKEPIYIQAKELFTNQLCYKCESYLGIVGCYVDGFFVILKLRCLNNECLHETTRELIIDEIPQDGSKIRKVHSCSKCTHDE